MIERLRGLPPLNLSQPSQQPLQDLCAARAVNHTHSRPGNSLVQPSLRRQDDLCAITEGNQRKVLLIRQVVNNIVGRFLHPLQTRSLHRSTAI